MVRKLVKTGNSVALILSKDMKDHLGVDEAIEVEFLENEIRLRKPMSLEDAARRSDAKFADAYKELAK